MFTNEKKTRKKIFLKDEDFVKTINKTIENKIKQFKNNKEVDLQNIYKNFLEEFKRKFTDKNNRNNIMLSASEMDKILTILQKINDITAPIDNKSKKQNTQMPKTINVQEIQKQLNNINVMIQGYSQNNYKKYIVFAIQIQKDLTGHQKEIKETDNFVNKLYNILEKIHQTDLIAVENNIELDNIYSSTDIYQTLAKYMIYIFKRLKDKTYKNLKNGNVRRTPYLVDSYNEAIIQINDKIAKMNDFFKTDQFYQNVSQQILTIKPDAEFKDIKLYIQDFASRMRRHAENELMVLKNIFNGKIKNESIDDEMKQMFIPKFQTLFNNMIEFSKTITDNIERNFLFMKERMANNDKALQQSNNQNNNIIINNQNNQNKHESEIIEQVDSFNISETNQCLSNLKEKNLTLEEQNNELLKKNKELLEKIQNKKFDNLETSKNNNIEIKNNVNKKDKQKDQVINKIENFNIINNKKEKPDNIINKIANFNIINKKEKPDNIINKVKNVAILGKTITKQDMSVETEKHNMNKKNIDNFIITGKDKQKDQVINKIENFNIINNKKGKPDNIINKVKNVAILGKTITKKDISVETEQHDVLLNNDYYNKYNDAIKQLNDKSNIINQKDEIIKDNEKRNNELMKKIEELQKQLELAKKTIKKQTKTINLDHQTKQKLDSAKNNDKKTTNNDKKISKTTKINKTNNTNSKLINKTNNKLNDKTITINQNNDILNCTHRRNFNQNDSIYSINSSVINSSMYMTTYNEDYKNPSSIITINNTKNVVSNNKASIMENRKKKNFNYDIKNTLSKHANAKGK